MFAKIYAKYYDLLHEDKPYKKEINFVYRWAEKPKSILDVGCGTGGYWEYYPKGTHIIGIEKSTEMVLRGKKELTIPKDVTIDNLLFNNFDCMTALFNVINYIPQHHWWQNLPIKKGGFFIFDIWDKKKVDKEGFKTTIKRKGDITRIITPFDYNGKQVRLEVRITDGKVDVTEVHPMYVYSEADIKKFCSKDFKIVDKKETETWQTWYRLQRR